MGSPTSSPSNDALRNARVALCLGAIGMLGFSCPSADRSADRTSAALQRPSDSGAADLASTDDDTTCRIPYGGPVAIVPVRTRPALARAIRERPAAAIVYETADTAIYEDGRVFTTNLAAVGEHLSAIGWAENPMRILGASARSGTTATASDWRSSGVRKTSSRRRRG